MIEQVCGHTGVTRHMLVHSARVLSRKCLRTLTGDRYTSVSRLYCPLAADGGTLPPLPPPVLLRSLHGYSNPRPLLGSTIAHFRAQPQARSTLERAQGLSRGSPPTTTANPRGVSACWVASLPPSPPLPTGGGVHGQKTCVSRFMAHLEMGARSQIGSIWR